jgi:hypothetical protein
MGALSMSNMIIKPLQRVYKYPLLFQALLQRSELPDTVNRALKAATELCAAVESRASFAAAHPQVLLSLQELEQATANACSIYKGTLIDSIYCLAQKCDTLGGAVQLRPVDLVLFAHQLLALSNNKPRAATVLTVMELADLLFMDDRTSPDTILLYDNYWDQWLRVRLPSREAKILWV